MEQNRSPSSKTQVKQIIDRIEQLLNHHAQRMQLNYVRAFPENYVKPTALSMPFMNTGLAFLHDSGKIASDFVFSMGYIEAAKSFYSSSGISTSEDCDNSALTDGIVRFTIDNGGKHIYFLRVDEDEFSALYTDDKMYFDYMSGGEQPQNRELQLTCNYLRNVHEEDTAVIVVIDDAFQYTGNDFSNEGKQYIRRGITATAAQLGRSVKDESIDVVPYDCYFSSLRPGLAVNYFLTRLKAIIEAHAITVNNIGKLLDYNVKEVISHVALASNNYVGTKYDNQGVRDIQAYYSSLRKPKKIVDALYLNPAYSKMFSELSSKASANLVKLEDPRLCSPLITAEWMFNNIGDIEGFDNTFICFGYLKLVEALMAKILIEDYTGCEMSINNTQRITISTETAEQLMLGNMIRFATKNRLSEMNRSDFCWQIEDALHQWKNEIRNGYFHKHTLDRNGVETIRNRTFEVIYMILGSLPK